MARGEGTVEVHNVAERLDLPGEEPFGGDASGHVPGHVRLGAWVSGRLLLWTIAGAVCYAALVR